MSFAMSIVLPKLPSNLQICRNEMAIVNLITYSAQSDYFVINYLINSIKNEC